MQSNNAVTLAAGLVLALAMACSTPTDGDPPRLQAARGGGGGGPTPVVDGTNPNQAPQDSTLDVSVLGANYDQTSSVTFLLDGKSTPKVKTNSTTFVSATELVANVTIAVDAVVAPYDVQVANFGGKKGVGIESFAVTQRTNPGQWDPPILTVTMRQGGAGTDAVRSDDAAALSYVDAAHISGNGNLMFGLAGQSSPRAVLVTTTALAGATRDRIYTNHHTNPGGDDSFGMLGMVNGSSGTAVFEVELNVKDNDPYDVLRYGKDCTKGLGGDNVVEAAKVVTTRSADGRTWTITGASGVHCKQLGKKPALTQVGTAGPFSITLVQTYP